MYYSLLSLFLLGCSLAGQSSGYVVSLPPLEQRPIIAYLDEDLQSIVSYTLYVYSATGKVQKWVLKNEDSLSIWLAPSSVLLCYPQLVSEHERLEFKPYGAWLIDNHDNKNITLQWGKGLLALLMHRAQQQGIALYRFNLQRLAMFFDSEDAWFFDEVKLKEAILNEKLFKRDFKKKPSLTLKNYKKNFWYSDASLTNSKEYLQLPKGLHMLYSPEYQSFFKIKVNKKSFYVQQLFIE